MCSIRFSIISLALHIVVTSRQQLNKEGWSTTDGLAFALTIDTHSVLLARLKLWILGLGTVMDKIKSLILVV